MGSGNTTAIPAQIVCMMKHSGLLGADQRFKHGPLLRRSSLSRRRFGSFFRNACLMIFWLLHEIKKRRRGRPSFSGDGGRIVETQAAILTNAGPS